MFAMGVDGAGVGSGEARWLSRPRAFPG